MVVMQKPGKERHPPEAGRGREEFFPRAFGESMALPHLDLDL